MRKICANAKASNILVMTVALDLDKDKTSEAKALTELKACSSDSRFRKGSDGNPAKLFWNATGATLSTVFKRNRRRALQPAHRRITAASRICGGGRQE